MTRCKQLRQKYHEAKTLYAKNKSIDNKMQLINASKSYKKYIKPTHNINLKQKIQCDS